MMNFDFRRDLSHISKMIRKVIIKDAFIKFTIFYLEFKELRMIDSGVLFVIIV